MRSLLASIILICLCLGACSYNKPELEIHEETAEITVTPSHASFTQTPTVTASPSASLTPSPSPTPFERKDVMQNPGIVIYKSERMLYVYDNDELCAKMKIALGSAPEGHKTKQGDGKTPEGEYYICVRNDNSKYYLSLGISYPNTDDAAAGLEAGLISQADYEKIKSAIEDGARPPWDTALGGEIMIHGSDTSTDWTAGCIAAGNEDVDYLWENCPLGTPVTILP